MIIHPHQSEHADFLGGKAQALAKLSSIDCNIPPWFAVTSLQQSNHDEITRCAKNLQSNQFAVRSSAQGEDGSYHSFAGQYATFLYVSISDLISKIDDVHESGQSDHLKTYQSSKAIDHLDKPTVLVQAMVTPDVSGIAFSADPVTGNLSHTIISGLWGTGSAIVSGEADADTWTVNKQNQIIKRNLSNKSYQHIPDLQSTEGVKLVETPYEKHNIACLSDREILSITQLARQCSEHFGCPQDIEWAIENDKLYLLQSRPITTLSNIPDPSLPLTVWDNSNIAESYSGITSPMTFSFAERAYEHVYREFCKLLSVPKKKLTDNDDIFPKMLGHIHGHVYYNLNSWYHVLAILPGFSVNRSFMEQMMGVKEPMPEEVVTGILKRTRTSKITDSWSLLKTITGLIKNHLSLQRQINAFYTRLNTALNGLDKPLNDMTGVELTSHYQDLEQQLLKRWDAPLVNDFFAMIFYGVLKSLCEKWLNDPSLQNSLLLDAGDIISAEPPRRIKAMAKLTAAHPNLTKILTDSSTCVESKIAALKNQPAIYDLYTDYLKTFGDRCLEELKLESPTVDDNPQSLLTSIGMMAVRHNKTKPSSTKTVPVENTWENLSGIKKRIFQWVLDNSKDRVRDRENLRFERTRLFGRVRKIIVELGQRLHQDKHLQTPSDVFFLTIQEVMGAYQSSSNFSELDNICQKRKIEQERYHSPPPDRFETRGPLEKYTSFTSATKDVPHNGKQLSGTGACPGIIRGKVRVVDDPRNALLNEGEILVAQQTDPGWVVLFPASSGLLVERGSLLSHSAIVARELQLPCIVSIPNITKRLNTGDLVEMNGSTGEIKIIDA